MLARIPYLIVVLCLMTILSCHPSRPYVALLKAGDIDFPVFQSILYGDTLSHVYDTHIYIQKKQFSGLLFMKPIDRKHRFSIVTKTGQKLLDVSVWNDEMTVHHVMSQLDKKIILDQLKRDFQLLIAYCLAGTKVDYCEDSKYVHYRLPNCTANNKLYHHFSYEKEGGNLFQIGLGKKRKLKSWAVFSDYKKDFPRRITIDHNSFINLRLELSHLRLN